MPKYECPSCEEGETYVAQTLQFYKRGSRLERRRKCKNCGFVFNTYEVTDVAWSRKQSRTAKARREKEVDCFLESQKRATSRTRPA
jgi:transcriptional regulator NrdR family protein